MCRKVKQDFQQREFRPEKNNLRNVAASYEMKSAHILFKRTPITLSFFISLACVCLPPEDTALDPTEL